MSEQTNLANLKVKARNIFAEEHEPSFREMLIENLIEQAYHTGSVDTAQASLDRLLEKKEQAGG